MKKLIISLIFIIGCHSADYILFNNQRFPPTSSVEIFYTSPESKDYIEFGYLEASGGVTVSKETLLGDLIKGAKGFGADAIINLEFSDFPVHSDIGTFAKPQAKCVMIKWKKNIKEK